MKMVKLARTKSNSPTRSTCVPKRSSQGQLKGSLRGFLYQEVDPKPHKSGVKAKKPAGQTCPAKAMAAESDTAKHFSEPNALRRWYLLKKFRVLEQLEAIADALQDNQTLIELDLSESQITDIGMQALANTLKINKKLKKLVVDLESEALREVEKTKKDRGEEFEFISIAADEQAARTSGNNIWNAAAFGQLPVVRHRLRQDPALLNEKNSDTALHLAAHFGNAAVAKRLLAGGAPLNVKNEDGDTPLHYAKREGKHEVAKFLEDAGAY